MDGRVVDLPGHIGHAPYRRFSEHLGTVAHYADLAARDLADGGRQGTLADVVLRPPLRFMDAYLLRAGFLDGGAGLAVAALGALYTGRKWGALWRIRD